MIAKLVVGAVVLTILCLLSYFCSKTPNIHEWRKDFFKVLGIVYVVLAVCAVVVLIVLFIATYLRDGLIWLLEAIFFAPLWLHFFM